MGVLSDLKPEKVFYFFEEITKIPHGSGNMEQISDYLVAFAKERNLFHIQDELKNVIIVKEATCGYEEEPAVILQGHMDMVAVKKPDCDIDMKTQGLKVAVNGDKIYAEGTSLGGDDGIAVAYALAILDSDDLKHPRLEVVLTVDEEVGLDGAREIDLSVLKGNRMINLDSEEEGIFLTSCAGGARVGCHVPVIFAEVEGIAVEVALAGLQGGHSGAEIHKERGNSNALFGRLLWRISEKIPVAVQALNGGLADNAIPRETRAVLVIKEKDKEVFDKIIKDVAANLAEEYATKDPGITIETKELGKGVYPCVTPEDTRNAASFLFALPCGVQAMSADMPGLVETSLNMGILELEAAESCLDADADFLDELSDEVFGELTAEFSVRSSVESAKYALIDKLEAITVMAGGDITITGEYPGWKYRKNSPLRDKMVALYEKMYGEKPRVEAIHAGLECGILGSKITDLDCVSMGPQMSDIHTTEETLSISSTARVWDYLVKLLEEKDN